MLFGAVDQDEKVSGRGESHPPALSEPDMNLSTHPAPIIQPHGTSPSRQWAKRALALPATACSHRRARLACRCSRFVFPHGPTYEVVVDVSENRIQHGLVEAPIDS